MTAALTAVLVGLAALTWLRPAARTAPRPSTPADAPPGAAQTQGWRRWQLPGRRGEEVDLAHLVTEVAARLRTGALPAAAWSASLGAAGLHPTTVDDDGVPHLFTGPAPQTRSRLWPRSQSRFAPTARAAIPATAAACRLSARTGAPLADVLEHCADGIGETARAHAARKIAMAGPRTTSRILAWLPAFGLLLGVAVGAEPLAVLFDGGIGTLSLIVGIGLMVVGSRWVARLHRTALRAAS